MEHLEYSQQVHRDASELLELTKIIDIFSEFGSVEIVGSYPTELMWDPDIDLTVVTSTPEESAKAALAKLAEQNTFQKLEFGDFKNFPRKNRPASFIVNARREWNGKVWEIETWFLESADEKLELVKKLKAMNSETREKIILEKKIRSESGDTKHDISSFDIYQKYF